MQRVAVVTGGARGIGRGCALELAGHGFDIALVDLLAPGNGAHAGRDRGTGTQSHLPPGRRGRLRARRRGGGRRARRARSHRRPTQQCRQGKSGRYSRDYRGSIRPHHRDQSQELLQLHSPCSSCHAGPRRRAHYQHVVTQRAVRRCYRRCEPVLLRRSQSRHPGYDACAGEGTRADNPGQRHLSRRHPDRARQRHHPRPRPGTRRAASHSGVSAAPPTSRTW